MPKRLFSDKAWSSDKLRQIDDQFRAEYAWIHPLTLCDGTFECDPHKVWALCYAPARQIDGRGAWTVAKVGEMLDEFDRAGLLLRQTDEEGKRWGYWTGGDDCLPSRSEWHKYQNGKRLLFETQKEVESDSRVTHERLASGIGLGVGIGNGNGDDGVGAALDDANRELAEEGNEFIAEKGEPGYVEPGQYRARSPKNIHKIVQRKWSEIMGPTSYCPYPSRFPAEWESLCQGVSVDLLIPAFELWAREQGKYAGRFPTEDFRKVVVEYMRKLVRKKSDATPEEVAKINAVGLEAWNKQHPGWKLVDGKLVSDDEQVATESSIDDDLGPEVAKS